MHSPVAFSSPSKCTLRYRAGPGKGRSPGVGGKQKPWARAFLARLAMLLALSSARIAAQEIGKVRELGLTSSNSVRLVIESSLPTADNLLLESADSPAGPWWKEPDFKTSAAQNGFEYITPFKSFYAHRFYRFRIFAQPLSTVPAPPYLRF